jgi:acyl-CoA synthetase (AMP-forming)/AMP-acid ligase II
MLERLLAAIAADEGAPPFPQLRRLAYAGAPMPPDRIAHAVATLGGRLVQFYGLVEAIPPITVLTEEDHASRELLASAGRPVLGAAVQVVDAHGALVGADEVGELAVGGDHIMRSYWSSSDVPGKGLEDGWLRTGDLARQDAAGYIYLVGREADMIITGGYNVFPREIEDVLAEDPAVAEAAVVGVPHSDWGEAVTAFVVPARGKVIELARLEELCAARLAGFKKPKAIRVVEELPRTSIGKVSRQSLKELALKGGAK